MQAYSRPERERDEHSLPDLKAPRGFTVYEFPVGHHGKFYSQREVDAELAIMRAVNADLLEALTECVRVLCHVERFDPSVDKAIQKATHAIAKAEGK